MDSLFVQLKKPKLTLKVKCSCCNLKIGKKMSYHTCKICKKMICDNCREGKMMLPNYTTPKTVCVNCWDRVVLPPTDRLVDNFYQGSIEDREIMNEFALLTTQVSQFLERGCYIYPWQILYEHIVAGYLVYYEIMNGQEIVEKQHVCDLCWYLWARSIGKGCPFQSGTIFIEDENHLLFNTISHLGYSRVLVRNDIVVGLRMPYSMRIGSSHLCAFIEFCENKAQWLLPEGETEIIMSKGKVGMGYEQVGLDFIAGKDGVTLGLPFNRHHLLFGRVPLKYPGQHKFTFLKFENYGTEALSDIVLHGIRYGLHVVKREREGKMPSRQETVGKKIMTRFTELVRHIFTFHSFHPIIKYDSMEQVLNRAAVKGISYIFHLAKTTLLKLKAEMENSKSNKTLFKSMQDLYNGCYNFLDFLVSDPTIDHLDVRFGREVILDEEELKSNKIIVTPRPVTVEELLPVSVRRHSSEDCALSRLFLEVDERDGFNQTDKL